jgi:gliding motility-associated-like protein
MIKKFALLFIALAGTAIYAQEICDNGIDDDLDGDIDLLDDECTCLGLGLGSTTVTSLIPNPSFEDMTCCPAFVSQLNCADFWIQASNATSDYFNLCNYTGIFNSPDTPIPGGGSGYAGFYSNSNWEENIGACLNSPMLAGTDYTLNFWTAWSAGNQNLEITLYGTPDCSDLPWPTSSCSVGNGQWQVLGSVVVNYAPNQSWVNVEITFTPTVNINAVSIGGPCNPSGSGNYYFIDELTLAESSAFTAMTISETGNWCTNDLLIEGDLDTNGGTWQWYKDSIAIVGEIDSTLDLMPYGAGLYTAVYTIGSECASLSYTVTIPDEPQADFNFGDVCLNDPNSFTDNSTIASGSITNWDWDFGDATNSTQQDPNHTYGTDGTYTVELVVTSDQGCTDTATYTVSVYPNPTADFEFEVGGLSSSTGGTGGCVDFPANMTDGSSVSSGSITNWEWDFGDGNTSSSQNPSNLYQNGGIYTIELTVTSDQGCTDVVTMPIDMNSVLPVDTLLNFPTCYQFSDGSIVLNIVGGGSGFETYVIMDANSTILNIGNSNAANTLGEGWYYLSVGDGTGCDYVDSVFIDDPDEMQAVLNITDPACFGDLTGIIEVDSVLNATGNYSNVAYFYNPNPGGQGGIGSDSTGSMGAGQYTLTVNDENGCSIVVDFTLVEPPVLEFSQFGSEPAYCRLFGYQIGNGVVFAAATGGTAGYAYEWTNLQTLQTSNNTTYGGLNPGSYQMVVTDANGCQLIQTIQLDSVSPIAAFTIISAELDANNEGTAPVFASFTNQSQYFANPNDPQADTTFFWNLNYNNIGWEISHELNFIPDTTYVGENLFEVCLVAINKNGCTDTACKLITVHDQPEIVPPNVFTAGSDGVNDEFSFSFLSQAVSEFTAIIVDRWGVTQYEINDISQGWDGTNKNGKNCPEGVYFYTYAAVFTNGETTQGQGTITLIRQD